MQNNLETLNDTLFDTLKQLKDGSIDIKKANTIVNVSNAIVKNTSIQLTAFKMLKGQIEAPKAITDKKVFATLKNGDTYDKKTEYAKYLGYKDVVEAIGDLGNIKFNNQFKKEFKAA